MLINIIQPISTPKMTSCRLLYEVHGYEIFQLGLFNSDPHAGNAWTSVPMVFPMISSRLISTDYIWLYMITYIYNIYIISEHIQTLGMDDWVRIRWLLGDPISLLSRWTLFHHGDGGVECEEHRGIRSSWCQTGSWGCSTTGPAWGGGDVMPWDVDDIWGFRATHTNTQYQRTAPVHVKGKSQPGDGHILDQLVVIICHH